MEAVRVIVDEKSETVTKMEQAPVESWAEVCERFEQDVHRIRDLEKMPPYTGLYECIDAENQREYYAVQELAELYRARRKTFLNNLGQKMEGSNPDE